MLGCGTDFVIVMFQVPEKRATCNEILNTLYELRKAFETQTNVVNWTNSMKITKNCQFHRVIHS